jgi:1-acyl-sn-glycerol-3-phosphate acyltransferase
MPAMRRFLLSLSHKLLLGFGRFISRFLFVIEVHGREHIPRPASGLLLISNHFSWFDPIILSLALPFAPAFLVATEAQERAWVAFFLNLFEAIPIWRGQVDRNALRKAVEMLQKEKVVGIFPEGGINPELAGRVAQGEVISQLRGNAGRQQAELIRGRSGAALLAVMSSACILPVGLVGTERIVNNLRRMRRTRITVRIGATFGPLTIDPTLTGQARRRQLDALTDDMMGRIAELLPPENRGYY